MKKAAAYARVSTLHQSDLSLVGQFEECDRYAEGNEIEIVAYYADKETGKVNRREQLDELIDHAN
ncbi:MAG: recombinase family protein, partial [Thermotogaceae bacterium]|nr:recombinase family protein [Thermotogaceae bacterium]